MNRRKTKIEWAPTKFSNRMSRHPQKNTKPEIILRKRLYSLGARYRRNYLIAPRSNADIAFVRKKIAIFVDGCFWHGCPEHGRERFGGPNSLLWSEKIKRNQDRDARQTLSAEANGWTVLRYWECKVLHETDDVVAAILSVLSAVG